MIYPDLPFFWHDCARCRFLGHYWRLPEKAGRRQRLYDLYSCSYGTSDTLVARYGHKGSAYASTDVELLESQPRYVPDLDGRMHDMDAYPTREALRRWQRGDYVLIPPMQEWVAVFDWALESGQLTVDQVEAMRAGEIALPYPLMRRLRDRINRR